MNFDSEYEEKFRLWKINQPEGTASLSRPEEFFEEDDECIELDRRLDTEVVQEIAALWDRIWYHRHQNLLRAIADGHDVCDPEILIVAKQNAQRLEELYGGKENLIMDDQDYAFLCGKMSALRWAMGEEWDGSLDT